MSCPECKELREVVTAQSVLIAELQAKVEQLSRDSSNSSQPPSQDRKFAPRKSTRKRSGRKKGGQIGREGAYRQFEKADKVVELIPTHCDFCEATLDGSDESPWRHQVVELPVVKPEVTEYLRHGLCCQGCGKKTHAKLPQGVTPSSFGPRLTALVGMLSGGYGLTKRKKSRRSSGKSSRSSSHSAPSLRWSGE